VKHNRTSPPAFDLQCTHGGDVDIAGAKTVVAVPLPNESQVRAGIRAVPLRIDTASQRERGGTGAKPAGTLPRLLGSDPPRRRAGRHAVRPAARRGDPRRLRWWECTLMLPLRLHVDNFGSFRQPPRSTSSTWITSPSSAPPGGSAVSTALSEIPACPLAGPASGMHVGHRGRWACRPEDTHDGCWRWAVCRGWRAGRVPDRPPAGVLRRQEVEDRATVGDVVLSA
jgi:hypothetical protein